MKLGLYIFDGRYRIWPRKFTVRIRNTIAFSGYNASQKAPSAPNGRRATTKDNRWGPVYNWGGGTDPPDPPGRDCKVPEPSEGPADERYEVWRVACVCGAAYEVSVYPTHKLLSIQQIISASQVFLIKRVSGTSNGNRWCMFCDILNHKKNFCLSFSAFLCPCCFGSVSNHFTSLFHLQSTTITSNPPREVRTPSLSHRWKPRLCHRQALPSGRHPFFIWHTMGQPRILFQKLSKPLHPFLMAVSSLSCCHRCP